LITVYYQNIYRYTILGISFILVILTFFIVPTRQAAEAFTSCWASLALVGLSVGGTMVMRKFHNSFSTGLFLGGVVGGAQFFFLLFLMYVCVKTVLVFIIYQSSIHTHIVLSFYIHRYSAFASERGNNYENNFEDIVESFICLTHSILLGSFAIMLGAHRSEIINRNTSMIDDDGEEVEQDNSVYTPPAVEG